MFDFRFAWASVKPGSTLMNGSAWAHVRVGDKPRSPGVRVEWQFGRRARFTHAYFHIGGAESDFGAGLALYGLFALWLSISDVVPYRWLNRHFNGNETGVSVHDWAVWIDVWNDDSGWTSRRRWQHIVIHIDRLLFGKCVYTTRDIETVDVAVTLPEGTYKAKCRMFESTWTWQRLRRPRTLMRAEITPERGITVPGKGENSWDCGDDAVFGLTCFASTPQEAARELAESVLRDRKCR